MFIVINKVFTGITFGIIIDIANISLNIAVMSRKLFDIHAGQYREPPWRLKLVVHPRLVSISVSCKHTLIDT